MSTDPIAAALTQRDFVTAGRLLAALSPADQATLWAQLPPEALSVLKDGSAWDAAWELVGRAEALGPAAVASPGAEPLVDLIGSLGAALSAVDDGHLPRAEAATRRLREAAEAIRRHAEAQHEAVEPLLDQALAPRDAALLRQALGATRAAQSGDLPRAAREAGGVLRAHGQQPSPPGAAEASWLVAQLARQRGHRSAERGALQVCAGAARRCGRTDLHAAALARLDALGSDTGEG